MKISRLALHRLPLAATVVAVATAIPATNAAITVTTNVVSEPGFGVVNLDTVGSADWFWVEDAGNNYVERVGGTIFDTSSIVISQFTNAGANKWDGQSGAATIGVDNHVQGPGDGGPITFSVTPQTAGEHTLNLYASSNPAGNQVTGTFDGASSNTFSSGNLQGMLYTVVFDVEAADVGNPIGVGIGRTGSGQIRLQGATMSVIPEPSSLALCGLGGLVLLRRRR
ncbi:PEP-CTERM sorting domain-containing protein [Haloferula chungangensis]|uniref:PEP-CTERM sorting domain-containing protein n=1 Tax=Haloferula chungangensis TaxID=1048331 RepID=A0ABW2LAB9_9BACT